MKTRLVDMGHIVGAFSDYRNDKTIQFENNSHFDKTGKMFPPNNRGNRYDLAQTDQTE
jgi:hypothetical protein